MKQILRLAITLCIITAVAGFGLGLVYSATEERIKQSEAAKTTKALSTVLPGYEVDPDARQDADGIPYWIGKKDGSTGYAYIATKTGYSSDIQTMVGVDQEGTILGISILFQQETPGLGARVQEVPSSVSLWDKITMKKIEEQGPVRPWFAEQFEGLKATDIAISKGKEWQGMSEEERQNLLEKNAVSALSGATITTRAIAESISEGFKKVAEVEGI